jgi:hypothetical protein
MSVVHPNSDISVAIVTTEKCPNRKSIARLFVGAGLNVADGRKVAEAINSICRDARLIAPSHQRWISK